MNLDQDKSCSVTITFEGLMVFHKKRSGSYEVGICSYAPDHTFAKIEKQNDRFKLDAFRIIPGERWRIELQDQNGHIIRRPVTLHEGGERPVPRPTGRRREDLVPYDFNWIMDFESDDFHDGKLEVEEGMMNPIIELTTGMLYTKCRIPELERKKGVATGSYGSFGFVAETIGLKINLLSTGEKVVVIKGSVPGPPIASYVPGQHTVIPYYNMTRHHLLEILKDLNKNADHKEGHSDEEIEAIDLIIVENAPSHLQNYYLLFSCVKASERFETKFKKLNGKVIPAPGNPCPEIGPRTYPYKCSPVLLGKRDGDLK